jgi:hypothetical protein
MPGRFPRSNRGIQVAARAANPPKIATQSGRSGRLVGPEAGLCGIVGGNISSICSCGEVTSMAVSNLMTVEIVRTILLPSWNTGQTTGEDPLCLAARRDGRLPVPDYTV